MHRSSGRIWAEVDAVVHMMAGGPAAVLHQCPGSGERGSGGEMTDAEAEAGNRRWRCEMQMQAG